MAGYGRREKLVLLALVGLDYFYRAGYSARMIKLSISAQGNACLLHLIGGTLERAGIQLCGVWQQGEEPKPSLDAVLEGDLLLHCSFSSLTRWTMGCVEALRRDVQPGEQRDIVCAVLKALAPLRIKHPESIVNIIAALGVGRGISEMSERQKCLAVLWSHARDVQRALDAVAKGLKSPNRD